MKNRKNFVSLTAAALTIALLGTSAMATAVPKSQKTAAETQAATEASASAGESLAIDQPETLGPVASNEDAEALALTYAELTAEEVTHLRSEKDMEDGILEYEVEFDYGNLECSYDINADTGEVLKFSYEVIDKRLLTALETGAISQEEAKAIALGNVEGAAEDDIRIETDSEGRRTTYEGKIIVDNIEYEFEIDADSGEIIEWSVESIFS